MAKLKNIFEQRRENAMQIKNTKDRNNELSKISQLRRLCKTATELDYDDEVIYKIANAKSVIQAENILKDARLAS